MVSALTFERICNKIDCKVWRVQREESAVGTVGLITGSGGDHGEAKFPVSWKWNQHNSAVTLDELTEIHSFMKDLVEGRRS